MGMSSFDEAELALVAYARREIDAMKAVTHLCEAVARRGSPTTVCALIAKETNAEEVFTGGADTAAAALLCKAVAQGAPRRLLLTRENDAHALQETPNDTLDWIAVEPLTTRNNTYLGSLAAMGPRSARENVLGYLPRAAIICSDIAFEILCPVVVGNAVHKFSNALSILTANVEYMTSTIEATEGSISPEERTQLVVSAGHAGNGARAVIAAATELRHTLPLGPPVRDRPRSTFRKLG